MAWRVASVRTYYVTILALALMAVVVLVLDLARQHHRQLVAAASQEAFRLARVAAAVHDESIAEAQRTLDLLARLPDVRGAERGGCSGLMAELRRRSPRYLDLGAARANGTVICSADPALGTTTLADRAWFRSAADWRQLGVGDYHRDAVTGHPAVDVAEPVLDRRGRLIAVVFAALDLTWLRELPAAADLPHGATIALVGRDGFLLARHPDVGSAADQARADDVLMRMLAARGSGVVEMPTLGESTAIAAFTRTADGMYVVVGMPSPSLIAAGRAVADGVGWIAVIGIVVLIATAVGSDRLLRRRLEQLVAATRALAAGNLGTRVGWRDTGTELGQVGQAFDEMAAAIERLSRRADLILDGVGEAVVGVDAEEHVTFVNGLAAALLSVRAGDLVGRSLHGVLREAAATSGDCPLCTALKTGGVVQSTDALLARPDGTALPVEYACTPKRDGGRTIGAVVALKDISARKRTDQERQRQRDTLHQRDKLASMATLLADVAHELNNPLTVIIAGATLLRDASGDDAVRRRAELLEQAAERCALTIRNFLALVRQYPATREEVVLDRIVKETVALVAYQLEVDEISVDLALDRDLPPVWADPHQLHQVVLNLVTNARHALRATRPPRRLTLATRHDAEHGHVVLEVADSGPGVAPELRSYVFRPFFTTKSPEEGTGLGLALCQDIVAAHGGTIRVDSAVGGGAMFVVELPLGRPEDTAAVPASPAAGPPRPGRVLVVDDDAELAGVLAAALRAEGHDVETAANGLEALTVLERSDFDVILSDVRMPKLDGPGLHRELTQRRPDLLERLVFVTGDILGRETAAFLERTKTAHLTKPFDIKQIRRVVHDVLDRVGRSGTE